MVRVYMLLLRQRRRLLLVALYIGVAGIASMLPRILATNSRNKANNAQEAFRKAPELFALRCKPCIPDFLMPMAEGELEVPSFLHLVQNTWFPLLSQDLCYIRRAEPEQVEVQINGRKDSVLDFTGCNGPYRLKIDFALSNKSLHVHNDVFQAKEVVFSNFVDLRPEELLDQKTVLKTKKISFRGFKSVQFTDWMDFPELDELWFTKGEKLIYSNSNDFVNPTGFVHCSLRCVRNRNAPGTSVVQQDGEWTCSGEPLDGWKGDCGGFLEPAASRDVLRPEHLVASAICGFILCLIFQKVRDLVHRVIRKTRMSPDSHVIVPPIDDDSKPVEAEQSIGESEEGLSESGPFMSPYVFVTIMMVLLSSMHLLVFHFHSRNKKNSGRNDTVLEGSIDGSSFSHSSQDPVDCNITDSRRSAFPRSPTPSVDSDSTLE